MFAYPKRVLAQHDREAQIEINVPRDDEQTCVECGAKVGRSVAHRVTVRVWCPVRQHVTTMTMGGSDPWRHNMTWYPGPDVGANWNAPTVWWREPTHEAHEFSGWACCREHAESAAEAKSHYGE